MFPKKVRLGTKSSTGADLGKSLTFNGIVFLGLGLVTPIPLPKIRGLISSTASLNPLPATPVRSSIQFKPRSKKLPNPSVYSCPGLDRG